MEEPSIDTNHFWIASVIILFLAFIVLYIYRKYQQTQINKQNIESFMKFAVIGKPIFELMDESMRYGAEVIYVHLSTETKEFYLPADEMKLKASLAALISGNITAEFRITNTSGVFFKFNFQERAVTSIKVDKFDVYLPPVVGV